MTTAFEFKARSLAGKSVALNKYKGKVLLVVNTASNCGFTPQYKGLQALRDRFHDEGFEVLGFPCNQFADQEPLEAAEIGAFCERNYGVEFPVFDKIEVNGEGAHPLFKWLASEAPGLLGSKSVKWNFTKFLVDREGQVVRRYAPQDAPESLAKDIAAELAR